MNRLFYGDCISVFRDKIRPASVDLVYLDRPFISRSSYNHIYRDQTGRPLPDGIKSFRDTCRLDEEGERVIRHFPLLMREAGMGDELTDFFRLWMHALRQPQPDLLAYMVYMAERLIWVKRIIKPTGSIYFHCDPAVSHYMKILMDGIFGPENFRNDITWQRTEVRNTKNRYQNVSDSILFYGVSKKVTWNGGFHEHYGGQKISAQQMNRSPNIDRDGRRYRWEDLTIPWTDENSGTSEWRGTVPEKGREWRYSFDRLEAWWKEGRIRTTKDGRPRLDGLKVFLDAPDEKPLQNIWTDLPKAGRTSSGQTKYLTQKPVALLERVISASSNPGDVVLDPFCGLGTTLVAAHRLGRKWIGIEVGTHAIKQVVAVRLQEQLGLVEKEDYVLEGAPGNLKEARYLWNQAKMAFQAWAVERVGGFPTDRKTADGGIDGRLYFKLESGVPLQSMAIEVNGGKAVGINAVRKLRRVLDNGDALMAGLIVMEPLTKVKDRTFRREMAKAGHLRTDNCLYPKMQVLSIRDILGGMRFEIPHSSGRK